MKKCIGLGLVFVSLACVAADKAKDHWSFQPLKPGTLTSIDAYISAKLDEMGLAMSPRADDTALLRRLSFDLTGLPPTPEDVTSTASYTDHVNRLLSSPRYGEHWGQHWLDVVRYADTHGFEVNTERPYAWPYRDYVIRAFNKDTRYDQFIKEQIAGDAMGEDAATGFLITASVLLPGQIGKDAPSMRLARQDSLDEIVVNIGQTFLGLSVGCARCHDHKFDPITARDYYSLQAFVAGVEYADRDLRTPEALAAKKQSEDARRELAKIDAQLTRYVPLAQSGITRPMVDARENRDRFKPTKARLLRFTILETNNLEPCVDELEVYNTSGQNIAIQAKVTSSGDKTSANRHELRFVNDGNYGNSRSWMSSQTGKGWLQLDFGNEHEVERVVWGRDRLGKFKDRLATSYTIEVSDGSGQWTEVASSKDRQRYSPDDKAEASFSIAGLPESEAAEVKRLTEVKRSLEAKLQASDADQKVFAGVFRKPDEIHLLNRGDAEQPQDLVAPAVIRSLGNLALSNESSEQERRRALADWIASPTNPLTARVMVNRIWQGHFGTGLVETASDFGVGGTKPTDPELLDWLAAEFIRSGWSVKHMHRLIVTSRVYQQSSAPTSSKGAAEDADVHYLWRFPSRRLEAESIRDAMLAISGQLNLKMYGRGYDLFDKRGGLSGFKPVEKFTGDGLRRMIYAHKVRREREAVFGAFDCPDAGQSTARRRESTTPIQALNLLNSQFTLDQSRALTQRVEKEAGTNIPLQIERVYQLALARRPTAEEMQELSPMVQQDGLQSLCRALFNSNEFLFVP